MRIRLQVIAGGQPLAGHHSVRIAPAEGRRIELDFKIAGQRALEVEKLRAVPRLLFDPFVRQLPVGAGISRPAAAGRGVTDRRPLLQGRRGGKALERWLLSAIEVAGQPRQRRNVPPPGFAATVGTVAGLSQVQVKGELAAYAARRGVSQRGKGRQRLGPALVEFRVRRPLQDLE